MFFIIGFFDSKNTLMIEANDYWRDHFDPAYVIYVGY
jgi:hypothetical protein